MSACRFGAERLKEVYGLRSDGCTRSKVVYCHLLCWYGTDGPNSKCTITNEPSEQRTSRRLYNAFNSMWELWVRDQLQTSTPASFDGAQAMVRIDNDVAINSRDDETPKGHKFGTVFSCKITQNGVQPSHYQKSGREVPAPGCSSSGVVPVNTPPRKHARDEELTHHVACQKRMREVKSSLHDVEVVLDTDDEAEENQGGVLTQQGLRLM
jgi:hypothetical protein